MNLLRKAFEATGVLLVILAVAAPGVPGMVLCVGSNGHVSVEFAHEGHCHDGDGVAAGAMDILPTETDDCCDGCFDLSLSSENVFPVIKNARRDRVQPGDAAFVAGIAPSLETPACTATRWQLAPGPAFMPSPTLLAHRTVVLRS